MDSVEFFRQAATNPWIMGLFGAAAGYFVPATWRIVRDRVTGRDELTRNAAYIGREADMLNAANALLDADPAIQTVLFEGTDHALIASRNMDMDPVVFDLRRPEKARIYRTLLDGIADIASLHEKAVAAQQIKTSDTGEAEEICESAQARRRTAERSWTSLLVVFDRESAQASTDANLLKALTSLGNARRKCINNSNPCHISFKFEDDQDRRHAVFKPLTNREKDAFAKIDGKDRRTRTAEDLFATWVRVRAFIAEQETRQQPLTLPGDTPS